MSSPSLLNHPVQNHQPHLMAGEIGSEVVGPGCDPGSDSGAWTFDHYAQLLRHRNTRPGVGLGACKIYHQRKEEKGNHVRTTGLLLRWQKTPLIAPKSRAISSHILRTRGRRAGLKRICGRQRKDRFAGSNSSEQCPDHNLPSPHSDCPRKSI